ncbi:MAG: DNA replication/repair protein RecF [bacterium]|nr:DNA replication/repair protein RecF [bacterium]
MHLTELHCDGFRSLVDMHFKPSPGINVIRGHNAQGKTSLLEAVLYLATSKSHRTAQEIELVRHEQREFHLRAVVQRPDREIELEAHWWHGVKRFRINNVAQTRVSDILGKMNVVFFSPEDVGLVRGSASLRRKFLDMELSQIHPPYLHALQQYRQIVKQRNELLRGSKPDEDLLDVWDEQLAQHGEALMAERAAFVDSLSEPCGEAYAQIAQDESMTLGYRPDVRDGTPLLDALKAARASDIRQAITTRGPHRDDLQFRIGDEGARQFASQGQQRTAALALKLAELEYVRERTGEYPVLMLDDVLSELDTNRSRRLFQAVHCGAQCLMTTTDLTSKDTLFGGDCTYYMMAGGKLVRQ